MDEGVKVFTVAELKKATKDFANQMEIGESLGYINPKTLSPAKKGLGMAVAVKRIYLANEQALQDWLVSSPIIYVPDGFIYLCIYVRCVVLTLKLRFCRLT